MQCCTLCSVQMQILQGPFLPFGRRGVELAMDDFRALL